MLSQKVKSAIRDIPDFPKKGIIFKDITPILSKPGLCREITDEIIANFSDYSIDAVVAIESRGFWFGPMIANKLNAAFIPVRKAGKLPFSTISCEYQLEYGNECVEMHSDALNGFKTVLIHDDVLATGGTACATANLVKQLGGTIAGFSFLIKLDFLNGNEKLSSYSSKIHSIVSY